MRDIRKRFTVREMEFLVYNRDAKEEQTINLTVPETSEPNIPANCVVIEKKAVSETSEVFRMTPKEFAEHATIERAAE
jgi:hypothetical protein